MKQLSSPLGELDENRISMEWGRKGLKVLNKRLWTVTESEGKV
jgi:hypothetical protein